MYYAHMEARGLISSELCTTIEIEEEISDLLLVGYTKDAIELQPAYKERAKYYDQLNETEQLIVRGVGLHLWHERLSREPGYEAGECYASYLVQKERIDEMIQQKLGAEQQCIAKSVIDDVHLPPLHNLLAAYAWIPRGSVV